jgi:hypothetical protein
MWFQFDPVDDAEAPGSRECHSLDARVSTGLLYLFGGNDQQQRMNAVLTLNTGEPFSHPPIPLQSLQASVCELAVSTQAPAAVAASGFVFEQACKSCTPLLGFLCAREGCMQTCLWLPVFWCCEGLVGG